MEIICRIISQGELQEREYTTQQGAKEKFATMPFVLARGGDTFHCEMVQDQARRQAKLDPAYYYMASLQAQARPWQDAQGATHYENRLTLNRIATL